MRRSRLVVLLAIAGASVALAVLPADGSSSSVHRPRYGTIAGMVPSQNADPSQAIGNDLVWHGGPVMHANQTYAIYWDGGSLSFPSGYSSTIDRFLADVGADSGKSSNVYAVAAQYHDGSGNIRYDSSFAGSFADHEAYPPNGCTDGNLPVCLTDAQLQTEIQRVVTLNGWPKSDAAMYFLLTPEKVGSCFDGSSGECAYTVYCAYHGSFGSGGGEIVYANEPYDDVDGCRAKLGGVAQYPNGQSSHADPTINVLSHEHNEAITDPNLDAWYDPSGFEIGDKCAWTYGATQGSGDAQFNEVIDGDHYLLQEEYDNATHACQQAAGPAITSIVPNGGAQGTSVDVRILGSGFAGGARVKVGRGVKAPRKSVRFVSAGEIDAVLTVSPRANPGPRTVTVALRNGQKASLASAFAVAP